MESIERKTLLYRSGLGFWCMNHVLGCSHGCFYRSQAGLVRAFCARRGIRASIGC